MASLFGKNSIYLISTVVYANQYATTQQKISPNTFAKLVQKYVLESHFIQLHLWHTSTIQLAIAHCGPYIRPAHQKSSRFSQFPTPGLLHSLCIQEGQLVRVQSALKLGQGLIVVFTNDVIEKNALSLLCNLRPYLLLFSL